MIIYTTFESILGTMLLSSDGEALTGVYFTGQKYEPKRDPGWQSDPDSKILDEVKSQLVQYFSGARRTFDVPVRLRGTPFQVRVWEALASIPFGSTTSYGALAHQIGKSSAVRAVGAAIGHNPISIIIPCHRVIGGNGSLTGYAGGLERKRALLDLEKRSILLPQSGVGYS
jgi:methylated-DNA-[protein]-cysteine S-methyltransferase